MPETCMTVKPRRPTMAAMAISLQILSEKQRSHTCHFASKRNSDSSQQQSLLSELFPEVLVSATETIPEDCCSIITIELSVMEIVSSRSSAERQNLKWRKRQLIPTMRIDCLNPTETIVVKQGRLMQTSLAFVEPSSNTDWNEPIECLNDSFYHMVMRARNGDRCVVLVVDLVAVFVQLWMMQESVRPIKHGIIQQVRNANLPNVSIPLRLWTFGSQS